MINCELFKNNCLVRIKGFNRLPGRRKMTVTRDIAEKFLGGRNVETDEEWEKKLNEAMKRLAASSKLILCDELQAIDSLRAAIRTDCLRRFCNASGIDDGLYLIKTDRVPRLSEFIAERVTELRGSLVPAFAAVYPVEVERVRNLWGGEIAAKLPDVSRLPELFGVEFYAIQFTVPEGLPPEVREAEEKKLRESFESARSAIVTALWTEFQGLLEHIVERLTPAPDGTLKTFQKGTIENLRVFISAFEDRNAFNDSKLGDVVKKASDILAGVGSNGDVAKRLRDYEGVRAQTTEAFAALKADVDKGVEAVASRSFDFSDE